MAKIRKTKKPSRKDILSRIDRLGTHIDTSIDKVLEAVQFLATQMDERFNHVDERFAQVDQRFEQVDRRFAKIDERFEKLEGRVGHLESSMVTKEYLDDKLADLHGDLVIMVRKEDKKVDVLVDILHKRHVLKDYDVQKIAAT